MDTFNIKHLGLRGPVGAVSISELGPSSGPIDSMAPGGCGYNF